MKICIATLLLFCCCLVPALLEAQDTLNSKQQFALIQTARKLARKTHNLAHLQELIASNKLTTPEARASAYRYKAYVSGKMHDDYLKKKLDADLKTDPIFMGILSDFDTALQICPRCSIFTKRDRYKVLADVAPRSAVTASYLPELKAAGYRPEKDGWGLSLNTWQGHHTWLGISVSPFAMIQPSYRLHYFDPKSQKQERSALGTSTALNALTISYARNLQQPVHDVSFSLFQVNAPVMLNLTTFGFQVGKDAEGKRLERGGYYRPEVVAGFGSVSVSYAYNLMFKKAARQFSEKHLLQVRYLHVFHR